jgi:hypothetical protein
VDLAFEAAGRYWSRIRPIMRGVGAGWSAQRACERSSDWPQGGAQRSP